MVSTKIEITTKDGICPSYVFRPDGKGPWPGVLVFMDGIGIRPAMLAVGERLAKSGYFALMPDLFYRAGPYEPMNAKTVFSDPAQLKILREKFFSAISPPQTMSDTVAFLEYMAIEPDVKPGGIATTGYCMGAGMSFITTATFPDKIIAAAATTPAASLPTSPTARTSSPRKSKPASTSAARAKTKASPTRNARRSTKPSPKPASITKSRSIPPSTVGS